MLKHHIAREILYRKMHRKMGELMKICNASIEVYVELNSSFVSEL